METTMHSRVDTSAPRHEPIIIATDGLPQSRGALALARAVAANKGGAMQVVAVHESLPVLVPDGQLLIDGNEAARLRADLVDRVRAQCARPDGSGIDSYEIKDGVPAHVISGIARIRQAWMIVVGLGRHELADRLFGDETALKVARASTVPVLAVPEGAETTLPRHAVVGVDFSEGSVRAAQAALRVLSADSVLDLVHVIPRERLLFDAWVSQDDYTRYVRYSITRFRARLDVPKGITINEAILSGDPAQELVAYARRTEVDLIAAGSHGHGFVSRLVLGSVTTKLLRSSTCSVLVVPPDAQHTDARRAAWNATLSLDRARWIEVLEDFTRRNAGRRTRLEVDDPELGAQQQEHDYPLLGIAYDPIDQRVDIMLGELGTGEPHLSRGVTGVDSLDVLTNRDDQDVALRLTHGKGQTLLTLLR